MGVLEFIQSVAVQDFVYWAPAITNGFGDKTYPEPQQMKCRWDDKVEQFLNGTGENVISKAVLLVPEAVEVGGYAWLGDIADLTDAELEDPLLLQEAYLIGRVDKTPLFKSTDKFVYEVYLGV